MGSMKLIAFQLILCCLLTIIVLAIKLRTKHLQSKQQEIHNQINEIIQDLYDENKFNLINEHKMYTHLKHTVLLNDTVSFDKINSKSSSKNSIPKLTKVGFVPLQRNDIDNNQHIMEQNTPSSNTLESSTSSSKDNIPKLTKTGFIPLERNDIDNDQDIMDQNNLKSSTICGDDADRIYDIIINNDTFADCKDTRQTTLDVPNKMTNQLNHFLNKPEAAMTIISDHSTPTIPGEIAVSPTITVSSSKYIKDRRFML